MKITPLGNTIQLEFEEAKAGNLITSSRESAVEYAKIVSLGTSLEGSEVYKVGNHVFVKAWAIDIINHEDKKYYFVNLDTNGVLAVVK